MIKEIRIFAKEQISDVRFGIYFKIKAYLCTKFTNNTLWLI